MKSKIKTAAMSALLALTSTSVLAEVYTVSVEINSRLNQSPLTSSETQAMSYPVLDINDATLIGSYCTTYPHNRTAFNGVTISTYQKK